MAYEFQVTLSLPVEAQNITDAIEEFRHDARYGTDYVYRVNTGEGVFDYDTADGSRVRVNTERYWIHDTLAEDQPDVPLPFGDATVGIVDEDQGGVFLYVHESNAQAMLLLLRSA